jgi:hypothetical protein
MQVNEELRSDQGQVLILPEFIIFKMDLTAFMTVTFFVFKCF